MRRGARTLAAALAGVVLFPAVAGAVPLTASDPVGPSNGATVLLVHGGAWAAGGADVYSRNGTVAALNRAGYRAVSMDYASLDVPRQVAQVAGVARALAKRGPVVLWGDSAGGQLALMGAARCRCAAAVVAVSAPADLRGFTAGGYVTREHVPTVLRGAGAWAYSPLRAARSGALRVPVLLVAHRGDPVVSFARQTVPLYRALKRSARGVRVGLVPLKGAVHAYTPEAVPTVVKFLSKSTNKKTPRSGY